MFEIVLIPAFKDNYLWLLVRDGRAAVVDPGDAAPVLAELAARQLSLETILITHHHADHQGGVADLVERWQPRVFGSGDESITACTDPLVGGERIEVLGQSVDVLFRKFRIKRKSYRKSSFYSIRNYKFNRITD